MKKLIFMFFLVLQGAACTTTSYVYLKSQDSMSNLARVSREPPRLFDLTHWSGWIGDVVDIRGISVIDSRPFGQWKRKNLKRVDLSAGSYLITLDCTNVLNDVREFPASIALEVEAKKEYILGCRPYAIDQRNILGFSIYRAKLVVIEINDWDSGQIN